MKMKLFNRITVMAFACLGFLATVFLALEAFGVNVYGAFNSMIVRGDGGFSAFGLIVLLLMVILLALLCVQVFMIGLYHGDPKKVRMITLKGTEGDAVLIAQETLDELVTQVIGTPEGISDIKITTGYSAQRVDILIDIAVDANIDIPAATHAIQNAVRSQLVDVNGIEINGVNVKISGINVPEEGVKLGSLAAFRREAPAKVQEEAPAETPCEEKADLDEEVDVPYDIELTEEIEEEPEVKTKAEIQEEAEEVAEEETEADVEEESGEIFREACAEEDILEELTKEADEVQEKREDPESYFKAAGDFEEAAEDDTQAVEAQANSEDKKAEEKRKPFVWTDFVSAEEENIEFGSEKE